MNDLGLILGWVNTFLLLTFVLTAIVTRRSLRTPFVALYALIYAFLAIPYKLLPTLQNWEYFLFLRGTRYLLLAAAVSNIMVVDFEYRIRQFWWLIPFLVLVIFGIFYYHLPFEIPWKLNYFLPRAFLTGLVLWYIPKALKYSNFYLLSYAVVITGMTTADVLIILNGIMAIDATYWHQLAISAFGYILLIVSLFSREIHAWQYRRLRRLDSSTEKAQIFYSLMNGYRSQETYSLISFNELSGLLSKEEARKRVESGSIRPVIRCGKTLYPKPSKRV